MTSASRLYIAFFKVIVGPDDDISSYEKIILVRYNIRLKVYKSLLKAGLMHILQQIILCHS